MLRILLVVIVLLASALPALAQCPPNPPPTTPNNKAGLIANINSCFADNTSGAITPAITRGALTEMVNSWQQYPGVNPQTGVAYTLLTTDFGQMVTTSNAGAVTFNLPAASSAGFTSFSFFTQNLGAGTATLTPTSGTVCGAATKAVPQGWGAYLVSDGTNWQCLGPFNTSSGAAGVTSVGLTMPAVFTVTGSPVTSSGTLAVAAAGNSGGIPYFSSATTMVSSGALTLNTPVLGGGAGGAPTSGTRSGNTTAFATTAGALTNTHCVSIDANLNFVDNGSACGTSSGGVTSVGLTMPAVFTVANSPLVAAGTLAVSANGTSGGIPYFASATTFASSAALTANLPVIGGGSGAAPTVGTRSGNTTQFVTTTGTQTSGHCVSIDVNGNHVDSGTAGCGGGGTPGGAAGAVQYNSAGTTFGGITNVVSNGTNLTAARLTAAAPLGWDNGAGAQGTSLSVQANGILQIGLGTGVNSNGWYQWGGQSRTTADMAVTNTTSLTNVPGLSITVISGRNYYFEFDGVAQGIASGNGGVAFGISGSASLSNSRYFATGIAGTAVAGSTTNTALSLAPVSGVGNSVFCQMRGSFTAGTSGTVTIQFAQQSSNTTASTLLRGATFNAWDSP